MTIEQEGVLPESTDSNKSFLITHTENKGTEKGNEDVTRFYNEQVLSAEQNDNEITNNDGSIKETLDTAFHNGPGYISDHTLAGSNRADFYEKRSEGKSDAEEELDYIKKQQEL